MKHFLRYLLIAVLAQTSVASATLLEIVCPCDIKTGDQTSLRVSAGVLSRGSTTSDSLRLKVINHSTKSLFDAGAFTLGIYYFDSTVVAGEAIAIGERKMGITPVAGTYFLTLLLEEKQGNTWTRVDSRRMETPITFDAEFGQSVLSNGRALYFDGTPSINIVDDQVTVNLPAIVNGSIDTTTGNLKANIIQSNSKTIFGNFFTAASQDLNTSLAAKNQLGASTFTTNFSAQTGGSSNGFDFFHLVIIDATDNSFLLGETVKVNAGAITARTFSVSGVDFLNDSDGDGIADSNEFLLGTDSDNALVKPGPSVVDVLVLISQGVPALYNADASARIDQLIQQSNSVLADSGLSISLNLVGTNNVTLDETLGLPVILDKMDQRLAPFEALDTLKSNVKADLVVMYLPFKTGDELCGLANLGGERLDGDFSSSSNYKNANTAVYVDCDDDTTIHEIGHLMGLGHSRRQNISEGNDGGTFPWAVGHGVDNSFATVMAYASEFGSATQLSRFSAPAATNCNNVNCGVVTTDLMNGADAVRSLMATQYQVATYAVSNAIDTDNDSSPDSVDLDDDNDAVVDTLDAFPKDATETLDTDKDGLGNNADTDDDNDGVADGSDAFPLDATESLDTDGDGIGNVADLDDDGDGVADINDAAPLDASISERLITARLKNIATRGFVGTGDNVLIGGLVITGDKPKTVVIRAKGPSLADANVPDVLADPQMNLFSGADVIDSNDDWQDHANVMMLPDDLKPTNNLASVIVRTLNPGAYTAIVNGRDGGQGIGIIEVFEVSDTGTTRLQNIATRGFIGTGDQVLIGGLVITGTTNKALVIRAKGPSLAAAGVSNVLADPEINIFSGSVIIDSNDNWQDHAKANQIPQALQPTDAAEASIYIELAPGAYTAIVSGVGGSTGVGIVEVFEVD